MIIQRILICTLVVYPVDPKNTTTSNSTNVSTRQEPFTVAIGEIVPGKILRAISNDSQLDSRNSINPISRTHESHLVYNRFENKRIHPGNESQSDGKNLQNTSSDVKLNSYYKSIRANIWTYVPPVIITVGVICNLLSFIVWVRSIVKKRGSSSSYFFACLAVADATVLFFVPMYNHVGHAYYNGANLRKYSNINCKFYYFMFGFSLSFSSHILASLALFRMVGVLYPHRYKQICSDRNAKRIILGIIACVTLVNIPSLFGFELTESDGKGLVCFYKASWNSISLLYTFMLSIEMYYFPLVIIVLANARIIWTLAKKRANVIGTTRTSRKDHAFSRNVTVLLAISLVYLITMAPLFVYSILRVTRVWPDTPGIHLERHRLGYTIACNISLLNSALNFWVYCITHPQFITEVKDCFQAFAGCVRSTFPMCKRRNVVGVIHVEEWKLGTAGPSGITGRAVRVKHLEEIELGPAGPSGLQVESRKKVDPDIESEDSV